MTGELTRRELQCLRLAGKDLSNKEIALRLGIAPSTVENHLTNAYAKLGTSDRRRAAALTARDYPESPQFSPAPMVEQAPLAPDQPAPGDQVSGSRTAKSSPTWSLPAPPRRPAQLAAVILVFAAVGGVITAGLVSLAAGGVSLLSAAAPPDAVLALNSHSASEKRP